MRIRVRSPAAVATLTLADTATVADLKSEITSATSLAAFDLKSGFPPQDLNLDQFDDELLLSDTGLRLDGEQLIASERSIADALKHPLTHAVSPPAPGDAAFHKPTEPSTPLVPSSQQQPPPSYSSASTAQPQSTPTQPQPQPAPSSSSSSAANDDPPELPLPSMSGTLVLRVMPDDNSCLFRAFSSAALGSSIDSMHELRSLIASAIASQPDLYTAAILDKDPATYCRWITRDDAWGGAIEIGILAQQFDVEVASINVQDCRVDRFNEGKEKRIVLVYSGIHYDVIALSPSEPPHERTDLPAEFDVKVFDADREEVLQGAVELCRVLQQRHYYTDTAGFAVRCNVCKWTGNGEKEATKHAKATGHMDFGESGA